MYESYELSSFQNKLFSFTMVTRKATNRFSLEFTSICVFYLKVTCQEPIHENRTTIRQPASFPNYFSDYIFQTYDVSYTCRKHHRLVKGNLTRVCNESGDWTGDPPVCKRKRK